MLTFAFGHSINIYVKTAVRWLRNLTVSRNNLDSMWWYTLGNFFKNYKKWQNKKKSFATVDRQITETSHTRNGWNHRAKNAHVMTRQKTSFLDKYKAPPEVWDAIELGLANWYANTASSIEHSRQLIKAYGRQTKIEWDQFIWCRLANNWESFFNHTITAHNIKAREMMAILMGH